MARKRDRLEIIHSILKIIQDHHNSIRPTPLLRFSNISSQSFTEYFAELKEKEFVREDPDKKGKKYVSLTDKGFSYLERYQQIIGFIEDFEL
ncbi:MAG: winged helix-turn-helix domain-containing protein [archaeon]